MTLRIVLKEPRFNTMDAEIGKNVTIAIGDDGIVDFEIEACDSGYEQFYTSISELEELIDAYKEWMNKKLTLDK